VATRSFFSHSALRAVVGLSAATLVLTVVPAGSSTAEPSLSLAEVTRQVAALNEEASNANEDFLEAQINVDNANRRLSSVQSRITREQRNLNRVRNDISSLASIAYRSGGLDSSLELLLADNPTEFLNRSASLDQLSRGQGASLRRAQASSQRLAQDQLALGQELGNLNSAKASAASAADAVSSRAAKARALLARLTAEDRARYAAAQAARRASIERASRAAIRSGGSSGGGFSGGSAGSGRAATAVAYVKAQVGDNYVWGADGPSSFDCSGLMLAAWGTAGVSLPHQSRSQYAATSRVSRSELRPGDLVFFYSPISHVGMYIGGGLMVHAANPGDGVVVDSINGYWSGRWAGAGRV
jgi:cell wall-associated NlpC family hydrolase